MKTAYISAPLVGSIQCGSPEEEEEFVEEYVSLPVSLFGKGDFYILRAKGDSMVDAGIEEDDLIVIERNCPAKKEDIVVALDPDNQNTRFWQANGESEKTSLRVKTRLHQLVEEGYYTGGCAPFGYKLVKSGVINKKGKEFLKLEQEPSEVQIVKIIFEKSVRDGFGSYKMAEYINERKILAHNGAKFQSNTIKRILSNEIYCGFNVRGGVRSRRIEELQIIDDEMFAKAQNILEQRKYTHEEKTQLSKKAKSSTLLGGNIYCAHCGQLLCANSFMDKYQTKDG